MTIIAQDGLFLDFQTTPQTAGPVKELLQYSPELIQNQPDIKEFYAFGYNGSQTNYSIFATYNVPNGQKASVDGRIITLNLIYFAEIIAKDLWEHCSTCQS